MNYKFSIITPEHSEKNIPFLTELYHSIVAQTYTNWEWVILLNGKLKKSSLPSAIQKDPRVVIKEDRTNNKNIGYLKNKAFFYGSGDILVEVDHDDILLENCLEKLNEAYQDTLVGFVYSDVAMLHMQEDFIPYNPDYGWTYRKFKWKEKELISMNSFPPTSHSMSFIWYAPDHVRSWRASVYKELGGHNVDMWVCEDHELMLRTYLSHKMVFIPEVLYIYRITGDNTWLERNQAIQTKTVELFHLYGPLLAQREANLRGLLKVNLGKNNPVYPDFLTIDWKNSDLDFDLNNGIPLADNSVGIINAFHILQKLKNPILAMKEIHRVLAHGGWAFIEVPSTDGRGAFQDPTHCSFWNENSFLYYTDSNLARFIENKTIRFQSFRCDTIFTNDWMKSVNCPVTAAWLVANKNSTRLPHTLKI